MNKRTVISFVIAIVMLAGLALATQTNYTRAVGAPHEQAVYINSINDILPNQSGQEWYHGGPMKYDGTWRSKKAQEYYTYNTTRPSVEDALAYEKGEKPIPNSPGNEPVPDPVVEPEVITDPVEEPEMIVEPEPVQQETTTTIKKEESKKNEKTFLHDFDEINSDAIEALLHFLSTKDASDDYLNISVQSEKNVLGTDILSQFGDKTVNIAYVSNEGDEPVVQYSWAFSGWSSDNGIDLSAHFEDKDINNFPAYEVSFAEDIDLGEDSIVFSFRYGEPDETYHMYAVDNDDYAEIHNVTTDEDGMISVELKELKTYIFSKEDLLTAKSVEEEPAAEEITKEEKVTEPEPAPVEEVEPVKEESHEPQVTEEKPPIALIIGVCAGLALLCGGAGLVVKKRQQGNKS